MNELKFQLRASNSTKTVDIKNVNAGGAMCELALGLCGAVGFWSCKPTRKTTWRTQKRFMVRSLNLDDKTIGVRCRPGDNGSVWEFDLIAPANFEREALRRLYVKLESFDPLHARDQLQPEDDSNLADADIDTLNEHQLEAALEQVTEEPEPEPPMRHHSELPLYKPAPQPKPETNGQAAPPPGTPQLNDLIRFTNNIATITARVQERERQIKELEKLKTEREEEILALTADLESTIECLHVLRQEAENDKDAKRLAAFTQAFSESEEV